ncbi:hypothetical protein [Owenweeksia hongkongensis]|uniref:hypothetical protein n=1 Tax=Owenweeksia hongkongensis TaxID=253245 RepID=UPI003A92A139
MHFKKHYSEDGCERNLQGLIPVISTRITLDFALCHMPIEEGMEKGKHAIYLYETAFEKRKRGKDKMSLSAFINQYITHYK